MESFLSYLERCVYYCYFIAIVGQERLNNTRKKWNKRTWRNCNTYVPRFYDEQYFFITDVIHIVGPHDRCPTIPM